jgi:hypothetical protein
MARTSVKTWLPLDRWAEIFGLDPLFFNQLSSATLAQRVNCGDIWYQHAWQDANRVSREDIANAIQAAELSISNFIGYDLLPTWHINEKVRTTRPARPELFSAGMNIRGMAKSVNSNKGYILSGGVRAKSVVQAGTGITFSDDDGDGFKETCVVAVNYSGLACELHMYFPGVSGADIWEIRPITVGVSGGVATISFKTWQVVKPDLLDGYSTIPLDADDPTVYLSTVDVYRVYNDPSQQATFLWEMPFNTCGCGLETCEQCSHSTQTGCLTVRDDRLGIFAYKPADWNMDTLTFDPQPYVEWRDPDRMMISYVAGWMGEDLECPYTRLDPYWETAIAYYAAALLLRPVSSCDNVEPHFTYWREDVGRQTSDHSYQVSPENIGNPFGTTRGGIYARQKCLAPNRRLITA